MFEKFKKPIFKKKMEMFRKEGLSPLERAREKGVKFLKKLRQVGVIMAISMISHYQLTHNNRVEKFNENGKEIFKHSDEKTTHILNYFGGVDSLSREEKFDLFKSQCQFGSKMAGHLPENFSEMNEKEIMTFFYNYSKKSGYLKDNKEKDTTYEGYEKNMNDFIDFKFPSKYEYDDTLYKILWETEKESGSPNIRWTFGRNRLVLFAGSEAIQHYDAFTHTCFIQPYDSKFSFSTKNKKDTKREQLDDLVAEWSHAKQFDDNYVSSTLESVKDVTRIAKDVVTNTGSFIKSQLKEYKIKGSIEYEAHKVIEPYLKKKFEPIKSVKFKNEDSE